MWSFLSKLIMSKNKDVHKKIPVKNLSINKDDWNHIWGNEGLITKLYTASKNPIGKVSCQTGETLNHNEEKHDNEIALIDNNLFLTYGILMRMVLVIIIKD
jgi:hypothetical protein